MKAGNALVAINRNFDALQVLKLLDREVIAYGTRTIPEKRLD